MKSKTLILGVLAGLAAGAALGILFAPDEGRKTRKKIMGGAKDLKDRMAKAVSDLGKKADELKDAASEKVQEAASNIKQKASTMSHHN